MIYRLRGRRNYPKENKKYEFEVAEKNNFC